MDDDKSLIEKTIEAVKRIGEVATDAAKHAMEPEPFKPGETVVMLPPTNDGLMGAPAMPIYAVVPSPKRKKAAKKKKAVKKVAKTTAKKSKKPAPKKSAKKASKKPAKKSVKKAKKAAKKMAKKTRKKANKSKKR